MTSFFSMLRPYNPLFWPQTGLAQWDHILPISPGNFGCLWFSGRCLFGRSAGCFLAPIAQNGPFWGENAIFSTLCPHNPLFWPLTDPAQWDHIFPISPGNSGCLRFSIDARSSARWAVFWPVFWPKMALFVAENVIFGPHVI